MSVTTATALTVNPSLVPDRTNGYRLQSVYESIADGCRIELVLAFDGAHLSFRPDPDTDSLETDYSDVDFLPMPDDLPLTGSPFDRFQGAELGWTWLARNQQGYCDSALLSFNGVTPNILLHVIGSSIKVFGVDPKGV